MKLTEKLFLVLFFLFSLQAFYLYHYGERLLKSVLLEQSKQQALVFLKGLRREITANEDWLDPDYLQDKIERALDHFDYQHFDIHRLYIFDTQGRILADSLGEQGQDKPLPPYIQKVIRTGEIYIGKQFEYEEQGLVSDILLPLLSYGEVMAILEVELDLQNTQSYINYFDDQYEREITLFLIGNMILFLFVFWYFMHRQVVEPIRTIDKTAEFIAKGHLEQRVPVSGRCDEIHHLALSVNHMASRLQALLDQQEKTYIQVLQSLAKALEAKDPYTAKHSGRVAKYSVMLGKYIGLSERELTILKKGALMHDLGKIAIPDHILNKPGALTDEEYKIMCQHPVKTAIIMRPLRHYKEHRAIAAWHHERWDGKGYPDGLKGEQIPLLARIVSIADAWDAMTGDRVYRKGMDKRKALNILRKEKHSGQWDPDLLQAFINMMTALLDEGENQQKDQGGKKTQYGP